MVFYVFLPCTWVECDADNQNRHRSPLTKMNKDWCSCLRTFGTTIIRHVLVRCDIWLKYSYLALIDMMKDSLFESVLEPCLVCCLPWVFEPENHVSALLCWLHENILLIVERYKGTSAIEVHRTMAGFSSSLYKSDVQGVLTPFKFKIKTWVIFDDFRHNNSKEMTRKIYIYIQKPTWILFRNYEMRACFGNLQKSHHFRPLTPTRMASQRCVAIWLAGSIIGEWTELCRDTKSSPALNTSADQSMPTVAHVSAGAFLCAHWQSTNTAHDLHGNSWLFFLFPALSLQLFAVRLHHSYSTHVHLFMMCATYPILPLGVVS